MTPKSQAGGCVEVVHIGEEEDTSSSQLHRSQGCQVVVVTEPTVDEGFGVWG